MSKGNKYNLLESILQYHYIELEETPTSIANQIGCSEMLIHYYLRKYGIPLRSKSQVHLMRYKRPEAREITKKAMQQYRVSIPYDNLQLKYCKLSKSSVDIAKEYDCSSMTVLKLLKEYNIPIRSLKEALSLPLCLAKTTPPKGKPSPLKGKKQPKTSIALKEYWKFPKDGHRSAMMKGMHIHPNKPEAEILQILDIFFPNQWKYTGDGSFILAGLNPDFVNVNGEKIVIEVFGDYWHGKGAKRYKQTEQGRIKTFAEYGFSTLVLWEKDIRESTRLELFSTIKNKLTTLQRAKHQLPDGEEVNHETKRSY